MQTIHHTRVDYSAFVLRTEQFHEQFGDDPDVAPYEELSIFRVNDLELDRVSFETCEHCGEAAEYMVEAQSVGGQDMFYCQEYMDNARQSPDFPDEFLLRVAIHELMGLE